VSTPSLANLLDDAVKVHLRDAAFSWSLLGMLERPARPVVVDANVLRGEIRRLGQMGQDTALITLAKTGFLHLFAARHVLDEVDGYVEKWARETGTPVAAYRAAWVSRLRPLINEVSVPSGLLTPDELARIEVLAQPEPLGDPDDVPTAIVAMVLAAPLLSCDRKPLAAVYGPPVDMAAHAAYLGALLGGGKMFAMSQWGLVILKVVELIGGLAVGGVRAVVVRTGGLPLAFGTAAAVAWALSAERTRGWLAQKKDPLRRAGAGFLEVLEFYDQAKTAYERLEAPLLRDFDVLSPQVGAARAAARQVAIETAANARQIRSEALVGRSGGRGRAVVR
jgi:hypothetical protein